MPSKCKSFLSLVSIALLLWLGAALRSDAALPQDLGTLGGTYSEAAAINAGGQVTGYSNTAGDVTIRAFRYTPGAGMQDLGTLGGSASLGKAINASGQVAGIATTTDDLEAHAFLWTPGAGMQDLGTLGGGYSESAAINASGQVTGVSYTASGDEHAFLWTPGGTDGIPGNPQMKDLGTLGGRSSQGAAINDSGQVTGAARLTGDTERHAFRYTPGVGMEDLGTLSGTNSQGVAINASGQVAGNSDFSDPDIGSGTHAFLWTPGVGMQDLGTLGGIVSISFGLNDSGQVTGYAYVPGNGSNHAFLWTPGGTDGIPGNPQMQDLGTLGGNYSQGNAINASGQVTGYAWTTGDTERHAVLWTPGAGIKDLGTLGGSSSQGVDINASGQIAGYADTTGNAETHAFLWQIQPTTTTATLTPVPNAAGWSRQNTTIHLQATNGDGVQSITYSASGAQTISSTTLPGNSASIVIDTEGTTTLTFYATDTEGNTEAPKSVDIKLDKTSPLTNASLTTTQLVLSASDNLSGVEAVYYTLDGSATQTYGAPFNIGNGVHVVEYWSVDRAGNEESHHTVTLSTPTLLRLNPNNARQGSADFVLVLEGSNFDLDGQVYWNGAPRTTTVFTTGLAAAYIPASDLAAVGTASVLLINPQLGGRVSNSLTFTITPGNTRPTVSGQSVTTNEDTPISGRLVGRDSDGDALTFASVSGPAHGTVVVNPNGSFTYTPAADYNGPDSFTFKANDGTADSSAATVSITVKPIKDAPIANDQSVTTNEDTAKSILLTASDGDGDSLTYSIASGPSHGKLSGTGANLTYTPAANYNGTDSFTFKVVDGNGGSSKAKVTITVVAVNDNPVANDDNDTTKKNTAVTINVLANDTDADGDTLSVASVTQPANGTVVRNANNKLTFTPAQNFKGTTSFSYTVSDGHGGSATATVQVVVK